MEEEGAPGSLVRCSGVAMERGQHHENEDRYVREDGPIRVVAAPASPPSAEDAEHPLSFYAVMDGHDGEEVAVEVSERILSFVLNADTIDAFTFANNREPTPEEINAVTATYEDAFSKMEEHVLRYTMKHRSTSGTCALTVVVSGDVAVVANIGDCRAVLARKKMFKKKVPAGVSITKDHTAFNERARIKKAGGIVKYGRVNGVMAPSRTFGDSDFKKYRLRKMKLDSAHQWSALRKISLVPKKDRPDPVMAVAKLCDALEGMGMEPEDADKLRAIEFHSTTLIESSVDDLEELGLSPDGVRVLNIVRRKKSISVPRRARSKKKGDASLGRRRSDSGLVRSRSSSDTDLNRVQQDVVLSVPDVFVVPIKRGHDLFMILASDGLWDVFTSSNAVKVAWSFLKESDMDPTKAANSMLQEAKQRGSNDDICVVIIMFHTE